MSNANGKDAFYFFHDSDARNDPKMLLLRAKHEVVGYGVYFMMIEILRTQPEYKYPLSDALECCLSHETHIEVTKIKNILADCFELGLLRKSKKWLWSDSLVRRQKAYDAKRESAQYAANIRWEKKSMQTQCGRNANALHPQCGSNAVAMPILGREGKGRERIRPPLPPKGDEGFEKFWQAYPNRKARPPAIKAWLKLKPDDTLLKKILDAISAQSKTEAWTKEGGQFIPLPASWLNARRWEDEQIKIPSNGGDPGHKLYLQQRGTV